MTLSMDPEGKNLSANVGIVGVGVMGKSLALNLLGRGFCVALFDIERSVTEKFVAEHSGAFGSGRMLRAETYEEYARLLQRPRKTFVLVTAGKPTDVVIENLASVCEADDIIIDTGNAHFRDQSARADMLEARSLRFLGMGISGGAEGARKGPAFFPGGTLSVWEEVRPVVEAAAARAVDGRPCVTMCGRRGAGSLVKMLHNAGEYAVLQIWGEASAALRGLGLSGAEVRGVLESWRGLERGALESYMLDLAAEVAAQPDELTEGFLVDHTADVIGSKGTGLWSVQAALDVGCPVPSLAAAVLSRQMSMAFSERQENSRRLSAALSQTNGQEDRSSNEQTISELYWAVYLSIVASYAQMFQAMLALDAAEDLGIGERLPAIISTFRAGCILQGALLQPMMEAFEADPHLPNLICAFGAELTKGLRSLRATCSRLAMGGEPAPVLQASLVYLTSMARPTLHAAQVVALQRDIFGRHGYKRLVDGAVTSESYNTEWREMFPQ